MTDLERTRHVLAQLAQLHEQRHLAFVAAELRSWAEQSLWLREHPIDLWLDSHPELALLMADVVSARAAGFQIASRSVPKPVRRHNVGFFTARQLAIADRAMANIEQRKAS